MGREVRRVPPNWEHPRHTEETAPDISWIGEHKPCYDETYENAALEWMKGLDSWRAGTHPGFSDRDGVEFFWDWEGMPPDEGYYLPEFNEDPTWYQLYETVSEGTPVSPPFPALEGLARYLADNGDFWYQKDKRAVRSTFRTKPSYEQALAMVNQGWAASMAMVGGKMLEPHEQALHIKTERESES